MRTFLDFADHVCIGKQGVRLLLEGCKVGLGILLDGFKAECATAFFKCLANAAERKYTHNDDKQGYKERPIAGEKI